MLQQFICLCSRVNDGKLQTIGAAGHSVPFSLSLVKLFLAIFEERREGNVLFNDAVSTFNIQLYVVRYMIKDHTDNNRPNHMPSLPGLLYQISSRVI